MIGVVIPVYNRKELLKQCLESLCLQTKKMFITIIVDDNSTENIQEIVQQFSSKLHIVYLKNEKNLGPGLSRQRGLNWIYNHNIDLVSFLDGDDMYLPFTLSNLSYEIQHTYADYVCSQIIAQDELGCVESIKEENNTWLHGKMYRVSFLKDNNIHFPKGLWTNEDLCFNLQAANKVGENKRGQLNYPTYLWRRDKSCLTKTADTYELVSGSDYIAALYFAAKELELSGKSIRNMTYDIFNTYNFAQIIKSRKKTLSKETKEQITFLFNLPEIVKIFHQPNALKKHLSVVTQFQYEKKKFLWYEENFKEWIKSYIGEEEWSKL